MADAVTTSPLDEQSEKLFTLMDADGDGQLTETEGHIVADAFGCNPATFWSLLEKYDADLDGTISRTEFAAALQGRVLQAFFPRHAKKDFGAVIAAAIEALKAALRVHITSPVGGSVAARRLRRRLLRRRFRWVCRRSVGFV